MKKLFSLALLAMMMVAGKSFAQGSLLATLSHDGEISAYYGAEALKSAMAAAEDGDVITLSSGQFNATNITKAVTLRGAGMSLSTDSINSHEATYIINDFTITLSDSLDGKLVMEGMYMKGSTSYSGKIRNAQFLKCRFKNFTANTNAQIENATFIHCRVYHGFSIGEYTSAVFINSLICNPVCVYPTSNIEFENCFILFSATSYGQDIVHTYPNAVINGYYKNCIIQGRCNVRNQYIPSSCTAYNCIGLTYPNLFYNMISSNTTNTYVEDITTVFKTYASSNSGGNIEDNTSFELTDEAAKKYLGTDGTQVGIYGGNLVYDENPTIPQITKCNVASKSTADGKLSVDIEVRAAEY